MPRTPSSRIIVRGVKKSVGFTTPVRTPKNRDAAVGSCASAWADRMRALYDAQASIIESFAREGDLAPGWTVERAADFFWALLSLDTWERLTINRGWSQEQYIEHIALAVKRADTPALASSRSENLRAPGLYPACIRLVVSPCSF